MGGSYFLPLALGRSVANDLMLTGRRMGAEEAARLGFVSARVADGELPGQLEALLEKILKSAPLATRALLQSQRLGEKSALDRALEAEALEQAQCYARAEFVGGVEALMAKENPPWCR